MWDLGFGLLPKPCVPNPLRPKGEKWQSKESAWIPGEHFALTIQTIPARQKRFGGSCNQPFSLAGNVIGYSKLVVEVGEDPKTSMWGKKHLWHIVLLEMKMNHISRYEQPSAVQLWQGVGISVWIWISQWGPLCITGQTNLPGPTHWGAGILIWIWRHGINVYTLHACQPLAFNRCQQWGLGAN